MGQETNPNYTAEKKSSGNASKCMGNFAKRLWDSIIFGAGATIGSKLVNSLF